MCSSDLKLSLKSNWQSRQAWEHWINSRDYEYFVKFDTGNSWNCSDPCETRNLVKKYHAAVDRRLINKNFNKKSLHDRSSFIVFAQLGGFDSDQRYDHVGLIKRSPISKLKFRSKTEFVPLLQNIWSDITVGGTLDIRTLEPGDTLSQLPNLLDMCDHYVLTDHFSLTKRNRDTAAWKRDEGLIYIT